ncbi:MAG TPA: hypothetical protein VLA17_14965, partial [Candidatus Limnocylindria bacterium]|nr:hypothetical protein [Candidatus Limnocylindria bacterium]
MKIVRVKTNRQGYSWLISGWLFVAVVLLAYSLSYAAAAKQKSFSSAEEAVNAAIAAARSN